MRVLRLLNETMFFVYAVPSYVLMLLVWQQWWHGSLPRKFQSFIFGGPSVTSINSGTKKTKLNAVVVLVVRSVTCCMFRTNRRNSTMHWGWTYLVIGKLSSMFLHLLLMLVLIMCCSHANFMIILAVIALMAKFVFWSSKN